MEKIRKQSTIKMRKHFYKEKQLQKVEEGEEEILEIRTFDTTPAMVGADYQITVNMGNLEFAKVSHFVQIPCYVEELDEALDFAAEKAGKRTGEEAAKLRKKSRELKGVI